MANLKAGKAPSEELSLTNRVFCNKVDWDADRFKYISLVNSCGNFIFRVDNHAHIGKGEVGLSLVQRKWVSCAIGDSLRCNPHEFDARNSYISNAVVEVEYLVQKKATVDPIDSEKLAEQFGQILMQTPLTVGQRLIFQFQQKHFDLLVLKLEGLQLMNSGEGKPITMTHGLIQPNTIITFEKREGSALNLIGRAKGNSSHQSIIHSDWDFSKMGIGGLDKEFSDIFRRTFSSRVFPPEVLEQLGLKHVRGILLYGPPGTGKTLMARQIGKMLNAREPKIVNGPSILDKYVGESEANIRKLFADAEEESKKMGPNSALHIIIFDEIDAICKARGSVAGSTAVHDTVVNQLLSKIDGVDQLNNILVIGMTNRRDMIDEALLRPGRLEVQVEISLPDEAGRLQILNIHTGKMKAAGKLAPDVILNELAVLTRNFSGAEIEGLCRAAAFTAMNRLVKEGAGGGVKIEANAFDKILVTREDFVHGLKHDIKPAFGAQEDELEKYISRGIIGWGETVTYVLETGDLCIEATRDETNVGGEKPVALLLEGPRNAGKTALATEIARRSQFPFIKMCTSKNMIGYTEAAKCMAIKKIFDDAYKSTYSAVILDNLEGLIDYSPVGLRYSNSVLQCLRDLILTPVPKGKNMLIVATTSCREALSHLELVQCFGTQVVHVNPIRTPKEFMAALEEDGRFTTAELQRIARFIEQKTIFIGISALLDAVQLVKKQDETRRVNVFLTRLQDAGALSD